MKGDIAWWRVAVHIAVLACTLLLGACGKSNTSTADELQARLSDPGWDQPPIAPLAETPLPSPIGRLLDEAREAAVLTIYAAPTSRSSSWIGGGGGPAPCDVQQGEYDASLFGGVCPPPDEFAQQICYECQSNVTFDKKIMEVERPDELPYLVTYVEKGIASSNHFNGAGGSSNLSLCARYQICSEICPADPKLPYSSYFPPGSAPLFGEISYRADNGPDATDDPCTGQPAYLISDFIWWRYNQQSFRALPGGNQTALYNILIAPSSERSEPAASSSGTTATYQSFYMGSLNMAVYGGSQIVSLESSTSSCENFRESISDNRLFYTNPIYGVLLKRWQDAVVKSMQEPNNNPWDNEFGWPVHGPLAYNNGSSQLTGRGAFYAWGIYFERGFIWWVDYIDNTNVPDEAQTYLYTGDNVFCKGPGDRFEKLPVIYYGGTGPLGVSVVAEASLNDGTDGNPPGSYYEVANPSDGPPVLLDMHAHGYGGAARDSDGRYKHYTWAFRDGTTLTNEDPFDDVTKYVQHAYAEQGTYTVRVQVIDANGSIAYGDSLPIRVGTGD